MEILVDTVSMSWNYDNYAFLFEQLGLMNCTTQPKRTQYYHHGEYYSGVLIAFNQDEYGTITDTFLEISGKGCRFIETLNDSFDWLSFFKYYSDDIYSRKAHLARLDIACDLHDNEISFKDLYRYTYRGDYICRSKVLPDLRALRTEVIYFGSSKSDRLLRIYNKALEQGIEDEYWVRCEFQMRNDCATSFLLNWFKRPEDLGKLFSGIMLDYLRFVEIPPGKHISDYKSNKHYDRLSTARWWSRTFHDAEKISQLYLPGEEYTLERLERYLERQTYSSLRTYLIAHDGDVSALVQGIEHAALNAKQKHILDKLKELKIDKTDLEQDLTE